ncbi:peptide ABC transporter permease [Actinorhabdospora filicis]|uniref:Peptide ABC transporter permease n=1 Tax=Actinorhabdospora filicis TaxID=1785913 RepID=A0A9W6SKW0_9ACTN|nr:peptide MFS transporter [Actinorhabdospora filicis]GLZ78865.1 peptide ABC transporter permease [Actinorhabdospora filicis]
MAQNGQLQPGADRGFFGHPRALATLFSTELWERFSYYGMRAILVLFLSASVANGGFGWSQSDATALYGVYTGMAYLTPIAGGWIADRLLGPRRSVLWGGVVIALGHYSLAVPTHGTFFLGLVLIVLGTGLLKPNISAMVGNLYGKDDPRRDAGFSLFYMGINIGAFIAPLVTGALSKNGDWHIAFGVAGLGMTIAVIWYVAGRKGLGEIGARPTKPLAEGEGAKVAKAVGITVGVVAVLAVVLALLGWLRVNTVLALLTIVPIGIAIFYFTKMFADRQISDVERSRLKAYVWLFIFAASFWLIYDQAGSVLNLFAENSTDLDLPVVGEISAATLQAVNPIFIIIGSPIAGVVWLRLGHRLRTPAKFALGLVFNGLSFIVMMFAALAAVGGEKVSPLWLVATYALQVTAELCISPVGLSTTTKLAPSGYTAQMLGLWFLSTAVGDAIGGQVGRLATVIDQWQYFLILGSASVLLGVAAFGLVKNLSRLMAGIH